MRRNKTERQWPTWLEPLRPDDISKQRMLSEITRRARPIFGSRDPNWYDVAAGWATILAPVAALITLVFIGIAIQVSRPAATVAGLPENVPSAEELMPATLDEGSDGLEYVVQLATMYEAP